MIYVMGTILRLGKINKNDKHSFKNSILTHRFLYIYIYISTLSKCLVIFPISFRSSYKK